MVVTFFGHRDCSESLFPQIYETILSLISQGADCFYLGNQGTFDSLVLSTLEKIKAQYPTISYCVVLAYLPKPSAPTPNYPTIYPEGLEHTPQRFAISHRNRWMVSVSDCVVAYIEHSWGGAAKAVTLAEHSGKRVIYISPSQSLSP